MLRRWSSRSGGAQKDRFRGQTRIKATASMRPPPAAIGAALADIVTPALLVSLPALEANERRMRELLDGTGVRLRPHFKAQKSSAMAAWQMFRDRKLIGF